jgi:GTP-binding protein
MKYIDKIEIDVSGGNGGDGKVSFKREKYLFRGGPDGGKGGIGGNIYLVGNKKLLSLCHFVNKNTFIAGNGEQGQARQCSGKNGKDLYLQVPLGTKVIDKYSNNYICEILYDKEYLIIAQGGKYGIGNISFKSGRNRAPRQHTLGLKGQSMTLELDFSLIADIGFVGFTNAGKSSLFNIITDSTQKVGEYIFTTKFPSIHTITDEYNIKYKKISLIDLPGPGIKENNIIKYDLGMKFLKHLTRTKLILYILDSSISDIVYEYKLLHSIVESNIKNINTYNKWIILNKIDLITDNKLQLQKQLIKDCTSNKYKIFCISSLKNIDVDILRSNIISMINSYN